MTNNGIVRRIDDLGRIVIPREVRKEIELNEGDPMEIFINSDKSITLKKYQITGVELVQQIITETINFLENDCEKFSLTCCDIDDNPFFTSIRDNVDKLNKALDELDKME